ncbi:HAD family hydrolase [Enterococcus xiangfangensis]|uniref:HAD family hydrolase n=1 Tax=Enterococcus xiangfangensis TaxID=1296537 RepID=UPI003D1700FE|nr:HAD family hydrolase [Enterococcus asini]
MLNKSAVFFDIDDTLLDNYSAFKCTLKKYFPDSSIDENHFLGLYRDFRSHSEKIYQRYHEGKVGAIHNYDRWSSVLKRLKVADDSNRIDLDNYYHECQKKQALSVEMTILLQVLKNAGILCGVLTNGFTQQQQTKLDQLKLSRFIDPKWQFISEALGDAKPNVSCFQKVADQLPADITKILYLGDSYRNDIVPALAANWEPIWLNRFGDKGELSVLEVKYNDEAVIELLSRLLSTR